MNRQLILSAIPFLFVWLWSTGFVGARFGLPYAEPFFMLSLRFIAVVACFWAMIWILKQPAIKREDILNQMGVGALLHGLYLGGVFFAISRGLPAGISAIIVGLQPILAAFFSWAILGAEITRRMVWGLLLGFCGLVAVIMGSVEITHNPAGWVGLAACLVSLAGITAATILQKRWGQNVPLLAGSMWQYIGALIFLAALSLTFENQDITPVWQIWAAIAWLVIALSICAVLLLMYMIREGEVARVSSYFYLVPPVAVIQTWWLFDETLSSLSLIGCAVVVLAVAMVVRD